MTEINVGDNVRTLGRFFEIPKGTIGTVTTIFLSGNPEIYFPGFNTKHTYHITTCEKVDTIELTDLNDEAIQKVKEFADSLRKQAPPTEDDKYIWITVKDGHEELAVRTSEGDYAWVPKDRGSAYYIDSDYITKWRPAQVS